MKNWIIISLISAFVNVHAYSQDGSCDDVVVVNKQVETLAKEKLVEKTKKIYTSPESFAVEIEPVKNEAFKLLCEVYHKDFEAFVKQNPNADYILFSCRYDHNTMSMQLFYKTPQAKVPLPETAKQRILEEERQKSIQHLEKLLEDLQRQYNVKDIEIMYNAIEAEKQMRKLIVKSVPNATMRTIMNSVNDYEIEKKRAAYGNTGSSIENKVADNLNFAISMSGKIPKVDAALKAVPFYQIIKSLPEVGVALGHAGAELHLFIEQRELVKTMGYIQNEIDRLKNPKK
jgi:Neuraminidase (sialidase)